MSILQELLEQKKALEQQIDSIREEERENALQEARELIETYELTADELFGRFRAKSARKMPVPRYRDPVTGKTWTGQGRVPGWLLDKNREDFLI